MNKTTKNNQNIPNSSRYKNKDTEAFLVILSEIRERVREDKSFANELLVNSGIINKNGELTKHYRHLCTQEEQE